MRMLFGQVPWWVSVAALAVIMGSDLWFVAVLKANSFATSVIQVETGQTLAAKGPYQMVRHPMYLGMIVRWLVTPLALGSLVAVPVFCALIPLFSWRLLNEENFLKRELPGYLDYCQRTPWRLIPFVW
jgi:protein-S-isoprenylcysteine O-methyltransferase Ste14